MAPTPYRRSLTADRLSNVLPTLRHTLYPSPPGSRSIIRTLAWNPLGSFILTGSNDRVVRVWNPERPVLKNSTELRGHAAILERAEWDPTASNRCASVDAEGVVKFWDVRTASATSTLKVGKNGYSLCWSPDGDTVVVGSKDDDLSFISSRTGTVERTHHEQIQTNQVLFSHSGSLLFLTMGNGSVKILSFTDLEVLHTLRGHTAGCFAAALSPLGRHLAVGGSDALITLWDTKEWICERTLDRMEGPVRNVSFSFDGQFVLGGSEEGTGLEIASCESGEYVATIKTNSPSPCIAWHPSRYLIAYSGDPKGLMIVGASGGVV